VRVALAQGAQLRGDVVHQPPMIPDSGRARQQTPGGAKSLGHRTASNGLARWLPSASEPPDCCPWNPEMTPRNRLAGAEDKRDALLIGHPPFGEIPHQRTLRRFEQVAYSPRSSVPHREPHSATPRSAARCICERADDEPRIAK
jgi:hypothetical protein